MTDDFCTDCGRKPSWAREDLDQRVNPDIVTPYPSEAERMLMRLLPDEPEAHELMDGYGSPVIHPDDVGG